MRMMATQTDWAVDPGPWVQLPCASLLIPTAQRPWFSTKRQGGEVTYPGHSSEWKAQILTQIHMVPVSLHLPVLGWWQLHSSSALQGHPTGSLCTIPSLGSSPAEASTVLTINRDPLPPPPREALPAQVSISSLWKFCGKSIYPGQNWNKLEIIV